MKHKLTNKSSSFMLEVYANCARCKNRIAAKPTLIRSPTSEDGKVFEVKGFLPDGWSYDTDTKLLLCDKCLIAFEHYMNKFLGLYEEFSESLKEVLDESN